jgi:MtN3 and saliva related transmembrane protein
MNYIDILGFACAFFTATLYLPQLLHIIKSKSAKDVSMIFVVMNVFTAILWIVYGYFLDSLPIIICDSVVLLISILILISKIYYDYYYE